MRIYLVFILLLVMSCNQKAQENDGDRSDNKQVSENEVLVDNHTNMKKGHSDRIDSVSDIKKGAKERSASFIKSRLQKLVGNSLKEICEKEGINYPPKFILFRTFKKEAEFEVWGANKRTDSLHLLLILPICAMDFEPGPKLEEGDGKTPEGFYNSSILYGSSMDFMWIKLNNDDIDTYGSVGTGSSFKMCLDYPNSFDWQQTKKIKKHSTPGSAICIHGNCVSIGCLSFENRNYLPLFLFALGHDQNKYGKIKIHIFPFRFTEELKKEYAKTGSDITEKQMLSFWNNLEEGYNLFEKKRKALKVSVSTTKYTYSGY